MDQTRLKQNQRQEETFLEIYSQSKTKKNCIIMYQEWSSNEGKIDKFKGPEDIQ